MWTKLPLGVAAWTFGERPFPETARRVAELGYNGLTLTVNLAQDTAEETAAALAAHGLDLFAVSIDSADLAHPETAVRQQAIADYVRLLDFAAGVGRPLVICRGVKGRIRPFTSKADESALLETAVRQIAQAAAKKDLRLVIEPLNRYETHLINTGADAMALAEAVGMENVGVYLNAFHMNIEEQDAAGVMRRAGSRLWLFAMSDSNRRAIGQGHLKLGNLLWAVEDINYQGPIILECLPSGSNPIQPALNDDAVAELETFLRTSHSWF